MIDGAAASGHPPAKPAGTRPGAMRRTLWAVGVLVGLVVIFFIADFGIRLSAQSQIRDQIQKELPSGVTADDLSVSIGGLSVIGQYLTGSFEQVELHSERVAVDGATVAVSVLARGIPTDFTRPVQRITGRVAMSQDDVNALVKIPDATSKITLGEGTLGYSGSTAFLGIPIAYQATVVPKANGETVLLKPESARITAGPAGLDLGSFVREVVGGDGFAFCAAEHLPEGVTVQTITVRPGSAEVTIAASNLVLNEKTLASRGTCS